MTHQAPSSVNATDFTFESIYGALRAQARYYLRHEQIAYSMSPTLLVHEAWITLARSQALTVNDRRHYVRLVSRVMKNLLVDHARRKRAICHGGALQRMEWNELPLRSFHDYDLILAVSASMERLAAACPGLAALVELRYLNGFNEREAAQILGVSVRTVRRQWRVARVRLMEFLQLGGTSGSPDNG